MIICGDVLEKLKELPAESVHCCITSPPYYGLRDYGTAEWKGGVMDCEHIKPNNNAETTTMTGGTATLESRHFYKDSCGECGAVRIDSQIGLESSPEEYIGKLVAIFREVKRVLRNDGTLWLNIGDSYASSGNSGSQAEWSTLQHGKGLNPKHKDLMFGRAPTPKGLKTKDLIGIPWMLAFALRADGWYLRSDIIWHKPNPMPESVTDRPTKSHEYVFLLSKNAQYYFDQDAVKEQSLSVRNSSTAFAQEGTKNRSMAESNPALYRTRGMGNQHPDIDQNTRNIRTVWTIATEPFSEAHFATFPTKLVEPCIMAGTSEYGCCWTCGAPRQRVVEREATGRKDVGGTDGFVDLGMNQGRAGETLSRTLYWSPSCRCELSQVPCTVLDPFCGSGTVGVVATGLGRQFIGIELNPKYAAMAERRIYEAFPLFC